MSATGAVAAGRIAAVGLMVDSCRITRSGTGDPVFDSTTGRYAEPSRVPVYEGACRVVPGATQVRTAEAGERLVYLRRATVSVPVEVVGVLVGDRVEVLSSELDPDLAGVETRVLDVTRGSHVTARRLVCEEVSA